MTDFEKMIHERKDAFEAEPPVGHFERFTEKLGKDFGKPGKVRRKYYLQIAAAVLFVLLAGNQARMYINVKKMTPVTLASVSPEYGEVEFYYTSAIRQGMHQWNELTKEGFISANEQQMMKSEMKEFDETYARLQKDLQANPEDERVINAMLEVYQTRLSIITLIINKLEKIKQQKLSHHETEI